ncbi:MAG: hypothetical protein WCC74_02205 [Minisyncoccia bacterium]
MIKIIANNKYEKFKDIFSGVINPRREWYIFITLFILGIIVLGCFSFYLYRNVQSNNDFLKNNINISATDKINLTRLNKIILNYEQRRDRFNRFPKTKLVDPSI